MSILTFYTGKIGDSGIDGENGTGVADIDGSKVDNPTFDILYNNVESKVGDLRFFYLYRCSGQLDFRF
mgnify:CR=1 FL=1